MVLDVVELLGELGDLPVVLDERGAVLAVALGQDAEQVLVVGVDDPEALDGLERAGDGVVGELVIGLLIERGLPADQDLRGGADGDLAEVARRQGEHEDRSDSEAWAHGGRFPSRPSR